MSYMDQLTCKRKKCAGELIVPLKIVQKGSGAVIVGRCPRCHESYKVLLNLNDKDKWSPTVAEAFFRCDVCGTDNSDNWEYAGSGFGGSAWGYHPYWYWQNRQERLKIAIKCKNCGKKRAKSVTSDLWADISKAIEAPPEKPVAALKCPHCGADITPDTKACPSCKKEIKCSACGSPIAPNARFCSSCGDKVELVEVPASPDEKANICPTCQEAFNEGSIFCSVCGQELHCDKCGSRIAEGAIFCTNCGDAVTKGDLSE